MKNLFYILCLVYTLCLALVIVVSCKKTDKIKDNKAPVTISTTSFNKQQVL